jgi:hypothetical protein
MTLKSSFSKSLCIAAVTFSMAATAHAAALRTFVSGFGNDSNTSANCAHAAPCRTFAVAVTVTSPGGEIEALDPAGYGPITISGPLTLVGLPGAAISAPSGGDGITITAGTTDAVHVLGLLIDGGGVGNRGIAFNAGGSLTITNCIVQNFDSGISIQLSSGSVKTSITNTLLSNNGTFGIYYQFGASAKVNGVIDHVVVAGNLQGIAINPLGGNASMDLAVSNSVLSNNHNEALIAAGSGPNTLTVSVDNTTFEQCGQRYRRSRLAGSSQGRKDGLP